MTSIDRDTGPVDVARPGALSALRAVAGLTALLIFVQAVLAGRGQFVSHRFIDIHGYVANAIFLIVLIQVGLVFAAGIGGRLRLAVIGMNVVLLLLVLAQVGLGYAGRDSGNVAAIHLPNGVLIFGLAIANISLISRISGRAG